MPVQLNDLVLELFAAIQMLSGYPVPQTLPQIHTASVQEMQQRVCGKPCPVKAFYHREWGVYLDETLDLRGSAFDRSVLLHELVHYVQNVTGRFEKIPVSCRRNHLAELEAYRIQNLYLASVNSPARALYTPWMVPCTDEARQPDDGQ